MKGITWSRDSHGLFDYESRHLTKRTMKATEETKISRHMQELTTSKLKESQEEVPDSTDLLKII
jgi:hypothetical protein